MTGTTKGYFLLDEAGISVTGNDSRDFLHRMFTCNIKKLQPGQVIPGGLLNPLGRLLAPFWCWCLAENDFLLQTPQDCLEVLAGRLEGYVFSEDVVITPAEGGFWLVAGYSADIPHPGHFNTLETLLVASEDELVCWTTEGAAYWEGLGYAALTPEQVACQRIEKGLPTWGKELLSTLVPLGLGWDSAIDHHKGCYTGQEVISRLTFVGHPQYQIIGLKLKELLTELPLDLQKEGKTIGSVTNCAQSVTFGVIGLARIRWQAAIPEDRVQIMFSETVVEATVSITPFSE
jgi:tRNA-modifying protein YgfZ